MPKLLKPLRRRGRGVIASAALASLALAMAGTLAASAPASASVTPDCWWDQLTLMNGWQSDQGSYGTGDPMYCVTSDGMVHLSGSLTQPSAGSIEFAVLPAWARPASNLYLSVYTFAGTVGSLEIRTDGEMLAFNGQSNGDVADFTSLAGISFPGTSVARQPLALLNGWQSAQGLFLTGDPSYSVSGGVVHLSGSLDGSQVPPGLGEAAKQFAVLPPGARPDFCTSNEAYTFQGVPGTLGIDPGGTMLAYAQGGAIYNSPSALFTSLANVSFPAAGVATWHPLSLMGSWGPVEGDCLTSNLPVNPAYAVIGGVVYLTGIISSSGSSNGEFTVLPPGARPTHTLYLTLNEGPAPHASLEIRPDGAMTVFGSSFASGVDSLAGLSYELSS
jgi:hypothetical protein